MASPLLLTKTSHSFLGVPAPGLPFVHFCFFVHTLRNRDIFATIHRRNDPVVLVVSDAKGVFSLVIGALAANKRIVTSQLVGSTQKIFGFSPDIILIRRFDPHIISKDQRILRLAVSATESQALNRVTGSDSDNIEIIAIVRNASHTRSVALARSLLIVVRNRVVRNRVRNRHLSEIVESNLRRPNRPMSASKRIPASHRVSCVTRSKRNFRAGGDGTSSHRRSDEISIC